MSFFLDSVFINTYIIVKQDVTEEELDAIMDSDQQNQIFAQSVCILL